MITTFIVEGKPQGKARARTFYNKRIGKMQSITPDKTKSYEDLIRWSYVQSGGKYLGDGIIRIYIDAFYPIPKSFNKKKTERAISMDILPTSKPDVDNIAKVVLDALNGVAFYDDSRVVCLSVCKYYAITGCMRVTIEELQKEVTNE